MLGVRDLNWRAQIMMNQPSSDTLEIALEFL